MKKFILLFAAFFTAAFIIPQESSDTHLFDLSQAMESSESLIDSSQKDLSSGHIAGRWKYKSGKYYTLIECLPNGTMQVTQKGNGITTSWAGKYKTDEYDIYFYTIVTRVKQNFTVKTEDFHEVWKITYELRQNSIILTSDSIPMDENGTDFSKPTAFKIL